MKYLLVVIGLLIIVLALVLPLPTYELPTLRFFEPPEPSATVMFGGDMQFDRYIRQVMETVGGDYIFSCIDPALARADMVVANLEGPITEHPSVSVGTDTEDDANYVFTFPPQTAALLARHNIGIVNIGNNHTFNFGGDGFDQTKQFLSEADISYFGNELILETEINGIPFTFINYNEFGEPTMINHSRLIKEAHEAGRVVVVYAHWGDEYVPTSETQRMLAHQYIDAGAALVVGSHPHIVQEVERYRDTYIYYSLGNFIFDQYFSEEVTNGLLLSVTFTKKGVESIQEIPIQLHTDGRTCVADPVER